VFDRIEFDREIDALIMAGRFKQAEEKLLVSQSAFSGGGDSEALAHVVFRLAHYYSMPDTEDLQLAEKWFLAREKLAPGAYSGLQTATFYFYVMANHEKTVRKVDEIAHLNDDRRSCYSALTLKGQSLIELHKVLDAGAVIDELIGMAAADSRNLPFGDEVNLIQSGIGIREITAKCRELLRLAIPNMRSVEYRERAKMLLDSPDAPPLPKP
jgi:hypothetical protein